MFPYVEVEGTHEEAGMQLGTALRCYVIRQLQACDNYYRKEYGKSIKNMYASARRFLPYVQRHCPEYIQELKGMATGAGVFLDDLLVLMCEEEIVTMVKGLLPEKCTTVGVKYRNRFMLFHNEDYDPIYNFYVVNAKIKGEPPFLSVAYMGTLPGSSAAFNASLAFSGNAIQLTECKYGVPKNFILRKMCSLKKPEHVIALWDATPRSIGNNMLFVTNKGIYDVEVTPDKLGVFREKKLFYHTNHLLHPCMEGIREAPSQSTDVRYARLTELLSQQSCTPSLLFSALTDHKGLCRHKGPVHTIAASIIDLKEKSLVVYKGNPCKRNWKRFYL